MSNTNSGPGPEKSFHGGPQNSGRHSRLKKLGWILFGTSVTTMTVVALFSLVSAKSGSGFIVNLDHITERDAHFTMGLTPPRGGGGEEGGGQTPPPQQDGVFLLIGEPLGNAVLTSNEYVVSYYNEKMAAISGDDYISGSWNYVDDEGPRAMLYTFYLNNSSAEEAQTFRIAATLTSELVQDPDSIGKRPYDYVRLALFMGDDGAPDDTKRYFANANTKGLGTLEDKSDKRECLAATGVQTSYPVDEETGERVIDQRRYPISNAKDTINGQDIYYCESFVPGDDRMGIFDIEETIAPGKCRRITFICYLEGEDPDAIGNSPRAQKLGFSLHIGI